MSDYIAELQAAFLKLHGCDAEYIETVPHNVVVKASGLAAGKGVLIPRDKQEAREAIKSVMQDRIFGDAGAEVVVEEFMEGPEASVLAFVDGKRVVCCPAAQDHKRIGEGDTGLNTGGMGAYCPAPVVTPALMDEIRRTIIEPCVEGMAQEGRPFVGCLFTGVMLTKDGPRCLEYNARFGDPETEAVLPLLDGGEEDSKDGGSDLYEIMSACARGALDTVSVKFHDRHAAVVVMASEGYPETSYKGRKITGLTPLPNVHYFHAGTAIKNGELVTNGGRILAVCGVADSLRTALGHAYNGVSHCSFQGAQFRRDIAHRAKAPLRIGVLGSTRGTDMQAIIDAIEAKTCDATIEVVISNKADAGILDKARKHNLNWRVVAGRNRQAVDAETSAVLKQHRVELVLLIGYMRILGPEFANTWRHRAMNIHPSLLPKFGGSMDKDTHQAVLDAHETETGCTVHWVDAEVDAGGILLQKSCPVEKGDTADSLKQKVQALEGKALIECIALFAEHRLPGLVNYNQKKRSAE